MSIEFQLRVSFTSDQTAQVLTEATFNALLAAAWARFDTMRVVYFAVKGGDAPKIPEAMLSEWLETSFRAVYELLEPLHPFRPELERYAREVAPAKLRRGGLLPLMRIVGPPGGGGHGDEDPTEGG